MFATLAATFGRRLAMGIVAGLAAALAKRIVDRALPHPADQTPASAT